MSKPIFWRDDGGAKKAETGETEEKPGRSGRLAHLPQRLARILTMRLYSYSLNFMTFGFGPERDSQKQQIVRKHGKQRGETIDEDDTIHSSKTIPSS